MDFKSVKWTVISHTYHPQIIFILQLLSNLSIIAQNSLDSWNLGSGYNIIPLYSSIGKISSRPTVKYESEIYEKHFKSDFIIIKIRAKYYKPEVFSWIVFISERNNSSWLRLWGNICKVCYNGRRSMKHITHQYNKLPKSTVNPVIELLAKWVRRFFPIKIVISFNHSVMLSNVPIYTIIH